MKTTISILVFCLLSIKLFGQTTAIPDPNFEQALINLGYDVAPIDGSVPTANITGIGNFNIANQNISDLTGIQDFTNMYKLVCTGNQLTSLDLTGNTQLTELLCDNNLLTTIDISQCTLIDLVDCKNNSLASLDLTQCTQLVDLNCSNNNLSTLNLSQNPQLQWLNCDNNSMTTLDVTQNSNLLQLSCQGNGLTSINVTQNSVLEGIYLSNNNLSAIDVTQNSSLTSLYVGGNSISSINLYNCPLLISLWINSNNFTSIDVSTNNALVNLTCYNNFLTSLDLSQNQSLYQLFASNNYLNSITLPQNSALTSLDISFNYLTSLDVTSCPLLITLNCTNNNLTYLDVSQNSSLNSLYSSYNNLISLDLTQNSNLQTLRCAVNELECLRIGDPTQYVITATNPYLNSNSNLFCIETTDPAYAAANFTIYDPWAVFGNYCLCDVGPNKIEGTVELDNIVDCIGEQAIANAIVVTDAGNYDMTNAQGEYAVFGDSGTVVIQQLPLNSPLFNQQTCPSGPPTYTENIIGNGNVVTGIDFRDEYLDCPLLEINVVVNSYLLCFENQGTISYCNNGFSDTNNVSIFLELPPYATLTSASLPYTLTPQGFYEFSIGTLNAGDCGQITFTDSIWCNTSLLGLEQCTHAWITPANDCLYQSNLGAWDNSEVQVSGSCETDSLIQFVIKNTSVSNMTNYTHYRIFEDGVLNYVDSVQLISGDSLVIMFVSSAEEYRIEVDQVPGYPTMSDPNYVVQSCYTGSGGATTYISDRPNLDGDLDIDGHCGTIIGSYDPNIKEIYPSPFGSSNYITPGTAIDYTIHFQNTGTAPAINIAIADTISPYLDLSTYQFLGSSDPVVADIIGDTIPILKFTFYNINLPDSTSDPLGSQGFVSFSLSPFSNLPPGTEIHNEADIYFDYNEPITTNDAWYTLYDTVPQNLPVVTDPVDPAISCKDTTLYLDYQQLLILDLNDLVQIDSGDIIGFITSINQDTLNCLNIGTFDDTITAVGYTNNTSCVSQITVIDTNVFYDVITACQSYNWIDGNTYTSTNNTATYMLTNLLGCDSLVALDLVITNPSNTTDTVTTCSNYTWIDGNTYTSSTNTPTWTLTDIGGCDSVVTLNLTIEPYVTGIDIEMACDTYTWIDSNTYTSSTNTPTYTFIGGAVNGCDSVVTLDLTISNSNTGTDVITACDSYTWIDGNTYTSNNNTATYTLTNTTGCDSIVTLDLTVTNSSVGTAAITSCNTYTWIDGNTYTSSTNTPTYTFTGGAANGCDSIVTLDLTILNSTTGTDVQTACDSFTWIDGNIYTSSNNTAIWTLSNSAGCDSVVTLDLTILNSSSSTDVITACGSYTWIDGNTYTSSTNTPTWVLTNAEGCDSTITLALTINSLPVATAIDNGDATISASGAGSYQWLDCDNGFVIIPGETGTIYIPSVNGNYAVLVDNGACSDTSNCVLIDYIGIDELLSLDWELYPNPTFESVVILFGSSYADLRIFDVAGKLVFDRNIKSGEKIDLSPCRPGVYTFELKVDDQLSRKRVIKQ